MSIIDIIILFYFGIGIVLSDMIIDELFILRKTHSLLYRVIMILGTLLMWPICFPISIIVIQEFKNHIAREKIKKVRNIIESESEHNDQLAVFIDSLSKRYPDVSFAKLTQIAMSISRWETERFNKIIEKEWHNTSDLFSIEEE